MNNVVVIGNLTRDPEFKDLQNDKKVAKFSVAVKRKFKKDETDFFDCEAWGKTAELISQYLFKGSKVGVQGTLSQQRWEKDGTQRSKVIINVEQLEFLTPKSAVTVKEESKQTQSNTNDDEFPF